jgi:hypothetical protein
VNRAVRTTAVYVLVALVGLLILSQALGGGESHKRIDLVEYSGLLERGRVASAKLYDKDHLIKGELENGD